MRRAPGLRARLTLAAATLAALALLAAGVTALALIRADRWNTGADAAQARIESYGALSARITARILARDSAADQAMRAVQDEFAALDQALRHDLAVAAPQARDAAGRAVRDASVIADLAHRLDSSLRRAGDDSAAREVALNAFAMNYAPLLDQQINLARIRRDTALTAAQGWARRSLWLAIALALVVPLVLAAAYLGVIRPLIVRIGAAPAALATLPVGAHDELGLLFARINRVTAALNRRRARLEADRRDLQGQITAHTADLQAAHDRLARIDADRRRFFADIGHELRTPLTVILAETELARTDDPDLTQALGVIADRAARLNRRIDDLMRVARSEAGTLALDRASADLSAQAALAIADLDPLIRRAGLRIDTALAPAAPVLGDADWLRQVAGGLIENAVKYGGEAVQISVRTWVSDGHAALCVSDTGPGLPADQRAAMTDRFARAQTGGSGFGVGLSLATWVAEAHGGRLILDNGPQGRGLAVTLSLPLAQGAERRVA